jgi:hypothetical protein
VCIEAAGDLDAQVDRYSRDQMVWFTTGGSKTYGEAFLSRPVLERLISEHGMPLKVAAFDTTALGQDAFVLRKV